LSLNAAVSGSAPAGDTGVMTRKPRSQKATIMCRHCGYKFKAGDRLRGIAPAHVREAPAEKKVASFMTKFFGVALAAIVILLIYLWSIGKFG
jgi:hypothetical protein